MTPSIFKTIFFITLFTLLISLPQAQAEDCTGFCFPEGVTNLGGGEFKQQVPSRAVIDVPGDIPAGIKDIYVELNSDVDVDIQLYDVDTDTPLVGWNIDALIDSGKLASAEYNGVTIEYSGYNGIVCGDRGHEYIKITGVTQNTLRMKFYGYKEGTATVTYSYGSQTGGIPGGDGSFEQAVLKGEVIDVPGDIPAGIKDLNITLDASVDVDIQLYDADTDEPLVGWKIGALIDSSKTKSKPYNGVSIEYSGYNGDGTVFGKGKEYIKITGVTRNSLRMKIYGYQEGVATVYYSWQAN